MINIFKSNKTKWMPLGNFHFDGTDFMVFARGNKKTGMMYFKVKSVNQRIGNCNNPILPSGFLDVRKNWELITGALAG